MEFFKVLDFNSAKQLVKSRLPIAELNSEVVPLAKAVGRRAAQSLYSTEELPDYNRSTVDGYAVKAASTYGATDGIPTMLRLVGRVEMGTVGGAEIKRGEAIYVPTGGAVPKGADAMVMLEYAEIFEENVAIYKPVSVKENLIAVGDDIAKGECILAKGQKITALTAGVLAALGYANIKVYKKLTAAVISTGDELVPIDGKTRKGQIRDTNTTISVAQCEENGIEVTNCALIKDGSELLDNSLKAAVQKADIVLISGGSSIGARDYTEQVLEREGTILVHGVALKPGKPTLIADVDGKLVFGLPGHPMACLLTLKLLLLDAIAEAYGDEEAPFVYAETALNFPSSPGRLTVQPVSLEFSADGAKATPIFYKSGLVSVLAKAGGYALIPSEQEGVAKGAKIKIYLL